MVPSSMMRIATTCSGGDLGLSGWSRNARPPFFWTWKAKILDELATKILATLGAELQSGVDLREPLRRGATLRLVRVSGRFVQEPAEISMGSRKIALQPIIEHSKTEK